MHRLSMFNVIGPIMLHKLRRHVHDSASFPLPHCILCICLGLSDISLSEDRQSSGFLTYDISLHNLTHVYKPYALSS